MGWFLELWIARTIDFCVCDDEFSARHGPGVVWVGADLTTASVKPAGLLGSRKYLSAVGVK